MELHRKIVLISKRKMLNCALAFLAMLSNSLTVKGIAKNKAIPYKGYNFLTEEQT